LPVKKEEKVGIDEEFSAAEGEKEQVWNFNFLINI